MKPTDEEIAKLENGFWKAEGTTTPETNREGGEQVKAKIFTLGLCRPVNGYQGYAIHKDEMIHGIWIGDLESAQTIIEALNRQDELREKNKRLAEGIQLLCESEFSKAPLNKSPNETLLERIEELNRELKETRELCAGLEKQVAATLKIATEHKEAEQFPTNCFANSGTSWAHAERSTSTRPQLNAFAN